MVFFIAHEYLGELYMMRCNKDKAIMILGKLENLVCKIGKEYKYLLKAINS